MEARGVALREIIEPTQSGAVHEAVLELHARAESAPQGLASQEPNGVLIVFVVLLLFPVCALGGSFIVLCHVVRYFQ
eukprot:2915873-Lingulodinium_polyedra.AAC.1